jgi:hypothetical protein
MTPLAVFSYVIAHLGAIGVVASTVGFLWKASRFFTLAQSRVLSAERAIHVMKDNHLTHMQASLESIEQTMKIIAANTAEKPPQPLQRNWQS